MNNKPYSQPVVKRPVRKGPGKWLAILGCSGLVVMAALAVAIALGGFIYLRGEAASRGEVSFRNPRNGESVEARESLQVRALARDEEKITRFELWADGELVEAQTSSLPGGSNPFPLLTTWRPEAGSHTLIARATNSKDETSQAQVIIEAVETADRDGDTVIDNLDACPDEAGNPAAGGCPDSDFDGIADSGDTCPYEAGMPEDGCPAPAEGDRDGDGMQDEADACPDEVGSPLAEGCPDGDSDGISDADDTCPDEPGIGDGCPTEGDSDEDGVLDTVDACPHEWGLPEHEGCPDSDDDDVIDPVDPCPADAGEDDGCPDSGGSESGEGHFEEGGFDEEGVSGEHESFGEGGDWEAIDLVRLDALEFSVTQDYDEIYCYAGAVGRGDMDHYGPFDALGERHWDIVEYMGGENTRTLAVEVGHPLELRVECIGNRGEADSFNLGSFQQVYDSTQWDGHVIEVMSGMTEPERGDPGHSFQVSFRLCLRSCDSTSFPPPALRRYEERIGPINNEYLGWNWDGNPDEISGYRLYVNGNHRETIREPYAARINLREYLPDCGERNEYTVTAYYRNGADFRESPPSNSVTITGEACPRQVKVTFTELGVSDTVWLGGDMASRGPIYGAFFASGSDIETLEFDGGDCTTVLWVFTCRGYQIDDGSYRYCRDVS
ncbi:MAG: thrombospondin type 3 repeat-containing protein [Anaerolineaceae bacterium]